MLRIRPCIVLLIALQAVTSLRGAAMQKAPDHSSSLLDQADSLLDHNHISEAIPLLQTVLRDPGLSKDSDNLRRAHGNLGYAYYRKAQYDSALYHYDKNLEVNIGLRDSVKIVSNLRSLGMCYRQQGLLGLAVDRFKEGAIYARALGDLRSLSDIYNSLALAYQISGDIESSKTYHLYAIQGWQELGDSINISFSYNNIARSYHELGQYDSCIYYNFKSLAIKKAKGHEASIPPTINNIGTAYLAMDSLVLAEKYLVEAYHSFRKLGNASGLAASYNNLADLSLRQGRYRAAESYLDSGAIILDQIKSKELLADHLELKVALLEKTGRFAEALESQRALSAIREELFQKEKLNVQKVEASYALREKDLERQATEREAAFAKAENRRYLQLIGILFVSVLVTGILLVLVYRLNGTLKVKNKLIELQKTDIIHRTSNVMAKIQSVLKIIAHGFESHSDKEKLMLAESVIISAGRLQDATYSPLETKARISLGPYLEKVTKQVLETFDLESKQIRLQTTWDADLLIPEEKTLNIGIIVSELVLNAVKYAFGRDNKDASIWVSIAAKGKTIQVQVRDNGGGISTGKPMGTGTEMIRKLVQHLPGSLNTKSGPEGTLITLTTTIQ